MIEALFTNIGLPRLLEFVAALVVTISYVYIDEFKSIPSKVLLYFLWLTVVTEFIGSYTSLYDPFCFEDLEFFKKYPQFERNYWLYNIYTVVSFVFYTWYYLKQLISKKNKTIIKYGITLFSIASILDFIFGNKFFVEFSQISNLLGLILIIIVLCMYYHEILSSNKILSINNSFPFISSIGVLIFHISSTPLFLSSQYLRAEEIVFLEYYRLILDYANYFFYGMFIFSAIKCYWFKKLQGMKFFSSSTLS